MPKVMFANETKHPTSDVKKVDKPIPMTRSASTTGLSSLSKGLLEHATHIESMTGVLDHMKEIVEKYENEIKELQHQIECQKDVIKEQSKTLKESIDSLTQAKKDIKEAKTDIYNIYNG